jgi:hypothetical protein
MQAWLLGEATHATMSCSGNIYALFVVCVGLAACNVQPVVTWAPRINACQAVLLLKHLNLAFS